MHYDPAGHYDRVAAAWGFLLGSELHYGVFEDPGEDLDTGTARLTSLMIDAVQAGPGDRILDVGCGTGAPACRLARELQASVVGISTSQTGIVAARERAATQGLSDLVSFDLRDGTDNRFEDSSFDRVWALESSHLMRKRGELLQECTRVLKPGGRLALCDIVLMEPLPFKEVRRLRNEFRLLREVFGDARMDPVPEYRRLAKTCALEIDDCVDLTARTRPTFAHWRANAHRYSDVVSVMLGSDGLTRFVKACQVLDRLWDERVLGYALLSAVKAAS